MENVARTPLYDFHHTCGARMAPFAGWAMPIQYKDGILKEHLWVRENAGIFDVSHMGQYLLKGPEAATLLERLTPSPFSTLKESRCRYTVLTNEAGGILDDLIVTRLGEETFYLVVNAARKTADEAWLHKHLGNCTLTELDDHALMAVQGPKAEAVLHEIFPQADLPTLPYMALTESDFSNAPCRLSRTGYTGEDGFEISLPAAKAGEFWCRLLEHSAVRPIGLGARDSLRLEAGYPLYGHDLDETTSPVEAAMSWLISGKNTGFIGAPRILKEKADGPARLRVGVKLLEKGLAREGTPVLSAEGKTLGTLCSGGFAPSLGFGIGQAYLPVSHAIEGTEVLLDVRGRHLKATTHAPGFIESRTKSGAKRVLEKRQTA